MCQRVPILKSTDKQHILWKKRELVSYSQEKVLYELSASQKLCYP